MLWRFGCVSARHVNALIVKLNKQPAALFRIFSFCVVDEVLLGFFVHLILLNQSNGWESTMRQLLVFAKAQRAPL